MGKSLVIVESPAKAKTINKYLGKDFVVKSSVGHIRDLPTSGSGSASADPKERARQAAITRKLSPEEKKLHKEKKAREQLIKRMGVDPEHGWQADYQILPGKEKVVAELKKLAEGADDIYLATDLDREGEAIAWHLKQAIGGDDANYHRVVFNEITKSAVQDAFKEPGKVDLNRVNAQQARRFLDRVVGYMVSPLLWEKIARGLSAGRVQSVAVRLVSEREREIRAFVPEEYWTINADLLAKQDKLRCEVKKQAGESFKPVNEQQAMSAVAALKDSSYEVSKREDKPTSSKPSAPFITSTLQQAASTRLGFGVKKTMMMAQRLYEAGYITYMRTDSTALSKEAVDACRAYVEDNFGKKYLPEQPRNYSSSNNNAQEAHEAIRPSDVNVKGSQLSGMERDAERLYQLIWNQFVACQMVDASYTSSSIVVQAGEFELRARGRVMRFDGYTKVMPLPPKKDEDGILPDVKVGDTLKLNELLPKQHFTKPIARFTEASLVKELEKRGIGRPSTYASIISTIQDRGYVHLENKRFYADKMGDIVTERLVESFSELMDFGFTASMEERLDDVAEGRRDWIDLLDEFYDDFTGALDKAKDGEQGMRRNEPVSTDIECGKCGRNMQIRTGSTGVFLGCSGYALPPKERCKNTMNLVSGDEAVASDDEEAEVQQLRLKRRCPICNTAMDSYLVDENRKIHICGNNPDCDGYEIEAGQFRIKGYDGPLIECDKCGSDMQLKSGRFGKYFGCTNEACKNTRKLLKNGEAAPPKMDPVPMPELKCEKVDDTYVLRDGAAGMFLAASGFPKNRETRAPKVKELLPHAAEIDPKYGFLLKAPTEDNDGNDAIIRFSRKSKEHYVQTEVNGKPSGWRAVYEKGRWQEQEKSKATAKKKK
ncbi:type I DNA topoisomerase [Agaribacterium haliotis]|uniref:type I DNA topoisomerase n=1 Tax=Agaribacterium haliotis TaxID=2013869 RepID=UPI000BB52F50|nr:type I DNA topoisomerase [Agaribacterium haliotis]